MKWTWRVNWNEIIRNWNELKWKWKWLWLWFNKELIKNIIIIIIIYLKKKLFFNISFYSYFVQIK